MIFFQSFPSIFYLNLSLDVLGIFLEWAIVLNYGFSPALLKIAEKTSWQGPFKETEDKF